MALTFFFWERFDRFAFDGLRWNFSRIRSESLANSLLTFTDFFFGRLHDFISYILISIKSLNILTISSTSSSCFGLINNSLLEKTYDYCQVSHILARPQIHSHRHSARAHTDQRGNSGNSSSPNRCSAQFLERISHSLCCRDGPPFHKSSLSSLSSFSMLLLFNRLVPRRTLSGFRKLLCYFLKYFLNATRTKNTQSSDVVFVFCFFRL